MNTLNLSQEPDNPITTLEALGALLAKARQARGLEQREVANRLGLNAQIIRALEEGTAHQVDAPVFVRGYLLRYARFLGLPEQDILERYKHLGINEQPPLYPAPAASPSAGGSTAIRWSAYLSLAALVAWLAWLGYEQLNAPPGIAVTSPPAELPAQPAVSAATPQPAAENGGVPAKHAGSIPAETAPAASPAPPPPAPPPGGGEDKAGSQAAVPSTPVTETLAVPASESPAAANATPPPPPALPPGQAELVLEFKGDCWVSVKDASGQHLAYETSKANTTSTLTGSPPFRIVLGNSGAVAIKLNGQTVDPAIYVKRGGISQFVLSTPKPGR
jgi:cytoskeleton protein RodZ